MRSFLFLSILSLLLACKNEKSAPEPIAVTAEPSIGIIKTWNMSLESAPKLPANGDGSPVEKRMYEGFYGTKSRLGYALHFFNDGTLVEVSGQKYQAGKWQSNDGNKNIKVTMPNAKEESFEVKYLGADSMLVQIGIGKSGKQYGFKTDGAHFDDPTAHPFHPSNNLWRVKPIAAETEDQLKARVKNHLGHLALILEAVQKNGLKVASFKSSPSCFHQYNSGIGLESKSNLQDNWYNCFFDKKDADKAYDLVKKEMDTNEKAPTDPKKNWVQNNQIILRHLV